MMGATYYLLNKDREYYLGKLIEILVMVFLACASLPKFIRSDRVDFVYFHYDLNFNVEIIKQ